MKFKNSCPKPVLRVQTEAETRELAQELAKYFSPNIALRVSETEVVRGQRVEPSKSANK